MRRYGGPHWIPSLHTPPTDATEFLVCTPKGSVWKIIPRLYNHNCTTYNEFLTENCWFLLAIVYLFSSTTTLHAERRVCSRVTRARRIFFSLFNELPERTRQTIMLLILLRLTSGGGGGGTLCSKVYPRTFARNYYYDRGRVSNSRGSQIICK